MGRAVVRRAWARAATACVTGVIVVSWGVRCAAQDATDLGPEEFQTPAPLARVALVIGAEHYQNVDAAANALNDAREAEKVFRSAGFSFVRFLPDPTEDQIYDYAKELSQQAAADEPVVMVVFFSGHGFQAEGYNYLVPVEARSGDLKDKGVPVKSIADALLRSRKGGLAIFFLDACRTPVRPDATSGPSTETPPDSSGAPTLVAVPKGSLFSLAAKFNFPARNAAYTGSTNSPYTQALIRYIPSQGMSLYDALDRARTYVERLTQSEQSPDMISAVNASAFRFFATSAQRDAESAVWRDTLVTNRADCIREFVSNHPDGFYVKAALRWLAGPQAHSSSEGGVECPEE